MNSLQLLAPAVTILLALFGMQNAALANDRPNIVFILADDLGAESMDRYGGTS